MMSKKITQKGFTLIETLLAVLILTVALAGPFTIAAQALNAARVAKDQTTALYLGQDAIEYIRFVRDTNRLSNGDWLTGAGGGAAAISLVPCEGSGGCYFDSVNQNPPAPTACPGSPAVCPVLKYDPSTGFYQYTNGTNTIFTRTVQIITPVCSSGGSYCNPSEATASTTVSWRDIANVTHYLFLHENLLNWE